MAEKIFEKQQNYGWGLTLNMTGKAPAVSKRIFNTLTDAQAYADDVKDSAIEGLVLSVVADDDSTKNGVYFVQSIKTGAEAAAAVLVKLGSADAATSGASNALTEAKKYTDQEVKKLADGAVKTNTNAIATLNGDAQTAGSVAKAVADAVAAEKSRAEGKEGELKTAIDNEKAARENAINLLDATVGETTIAEGKHVAVQVVEENGKLTSLTVNENDIASAQALATEKKSREDADQAINDKIGQVGTGTTLVAMIDAEADRATKAESDLAKRVTVNETSINTLKGDAATEGSVAYAVAAEKSRAEGKEGELKTAIDNEKSARTTADTALANRLTIIEGEGEGSIKKAIADIKGTLGETDAQTLAALNDRIDDVITNAKTYSIAKATKSEVASLGTNVKEAYKLVDEDKVRVGEFIPVYKDSSLKSAVLKGQKLVFTYTLADETEEVVEIDVSTFLAESEFKDGLQVVDHVVSVKRDAASEGFLTVSANGVKLSGVQAAIDTEKTRAEREELRLNNAITDETKARKDAINLLDATVGGTTVAEGKHVAVQVVEENGKLKSLTVTESDIAKASELDALEAAVGTGFNSTDTVAKAITANKTAINTLNADSGTTGSVAKAVADVKSDLIGNADEGYNTLGKLENKVKAVDAAAKAAATTITTKNDGHVKVSVSKDNSTSALTYTISETDIASAQELGALEAVVGTGFTTGATVANRIAVLEGVTVTGENAIVVDESSATANKKVSLKLGTQPAEGVAGVVLSQDANGLVAKLYWGTF